MPPFSSTWRATSSSFSRVRETRNTVPPASPMRSAVSSPMPEEAPVIITRLSLMAVASERSRNSAGSMLRSQ